jgi:alkyldihydroxyacetonephosphate synthase
MAEMLWSGWGDPAQATSLPPAIVGLLRQGLGVTHQGTPAPPLEELVLPESRLRDGLLDAITDVDRSAEARIRHTRGKSTPDLLRARARDFATAPDAVVAPAGHDEVQAVLTACSEHRIAVIPFGGGTSVVGGLEPDAAGYAALVALDLRRLDSLTDLDETSRVATLQPGLRGPEAERLLNERGYTLGHFPQSYEYASVGGFAAARSSGQASAGYGRFDERVVRLTVATPRGTVQLGRAPKSAAGPDLRQLFLGSEGAFGVITEVGVEVRPVPDTRVYEGWRFESFAHGADTLRGLVQDGPTPTVLRLSDEAETALNLARPSQIGTADGGGCLAIVGYEGSAAEVESRRGAVTPMLEAAGAQPDPGAGETWAHGRYRAPYLRDALLDAGALVETLETATFWSNLHTLYAAVTDALQTSLGTAVILTHISHLYRSGASLYFTVAAAQTDDPLGQWQAAKEAASDAIVQSGGEITHHHGIGIDHRDHYARELGPLAIEALRAVKDTFDPNHVMNPGVLIR